MGRGKKDKIKTISIKTAGIIGIKIRDPGPCPEAPCPIKFPPAKPDPELLKIAQKLTPQQLANFTPTN